MCVYSSSTLPNVLSINSSLSHPPASPRVSVCLAVSLASQHALTCSFIHQSPLALLVHHPPFLLHLLLYHFLADHVSLYPPPVSVAVHLPQSVSLLRVASWLLSVSGGRVVSVSLLLFPAVSSLPLKERHEKKECQQGN